MSVLVRLCGSVPNCEPQSPFACVRADGLCSSSILASENSPPSLAASSQPHPGSYPLHTHTRTHAHTAYTHTQPPPHLHICVTLHPHTHAARPQGPVPVRPHTHDTPPLCRPRWQHTPVTGTHVSTHMPDEQPSHTPPHASRTLDLPVTPMSHLTHDHLFLTPAVTGTRRHRHPPRGTRTYMHMSAGGAHTQPPQRSESVSPVTQPTSQVLRKAPARRDGPPASPHCRLERSGRARHPHPDTWDH